MSLITVKITDKAISAHIPLHKVTRIRDTLNPLIQIRFGTNRAHAKWFILHRNSWKKVGDWPESKTRDIRQGFSILINKIRNKQEAYITKDCFSNVGDLITWYQERKANDAHLSDQRKKDIKSAVGCHLLPIFENAKFEDLTHAYIDKYFIWPLQKKTAKSTVAKLFRTLKAAFYDASNLHMIESNPLVNMKIADFGNFICKPKGSALQPYMAQAILDELQEQKVITRVIVLLMITLGTRIGETRQAKWKNFHFGKQSVWLIPETDTKTSEAHTIYLPNDIAELLLQWKQFQASKHYKGLLVFPNHTDKACISSNEASAFIHEFSGGEWTSHDLRKCARICWAEQGTDFMVGEKMLNHKLGKTAEAYLDTTAKELRLEALTRHVEWLKVLKKDCFLSVCAQSS